MKNLNEIFDETNAKDLDNITESIKDEKLPEGVSLESLTSRIKSEAGIRKSLSSRLNRRFVAAVACLAIAVAVIPTSFAIAKLQRETPFINGTDETDAERHPAEDVPGAATGDPQEYPTEDSSVIIDDPIEFPTERPIYPPEHGTNYPPEGDTIVVIIPPEATAPVGGEFLWVDTRDKNNAHASTIENAIEWPAFANGFKYLELTYGDTLYTGRCAEIPAAFVSGEVLGNALAHDGYYDVSCLVYEIKGISPELMVAARFGSEGKNDGYYVFAANKKPETLGELISDYNLSGYIQLSYFTNERNGDRFALKQYAYEDIWRALSGSGDAVIVSSDSIPAPREGMKSVSFGILSDVLGISCRTLKISADGYVTTDMFGDELCFFIGTESAEKLIYLSYSLSAGEVEKTALTGTITEIDGDYITVNDGICMKNGDGISFKVKINSCIRHYIRYDTIRVGYKVSVYYDGVVYQSEPTVINGAYEVLHVSIYGGTIVIPE